MNYYYSVDGSEVLGPCSLDDLTDYLVGGSLPPSTQICAEGAETWQNIACVVTPPLEQPAQPPAIRQRPYHPETITQTPATVPYVIKVLTTKDRAFGSKFDPEKLEAALNSYASEGWSVAGCDSAEFPGFLNPRSEMITVMHRIGGRMKQYKILTQKDRVFGGKFDPERLEKAINSYVPEGWQVRAVTTATFPGFGSNREEMIVVLEKEI